MGAREVYTADHTGVSFMLSHVAEITSITPSTSGTLGGDIITIKGVGFPTELSSSSVVIAGVPCSVLTASSSALTCVLGPYNASAAPSMGSDQPGDRGIDARIWYNAVSPHFFPAKPIQLAGLCDDQAALGCRMPGAEKHSWWVQRGLTTFSGAAWSDLLVS